MSGEFDKGEGELNSNLINVGSTSTDNPAGTHWVFYCVISQD